MPQIASKISKLFRPKFFFFIKFRNIPFSKVAIGDENGLLELYTANNLSYITSIQAHRSQINRIKQSPFNTNYVATCSGDSTVKIWNATNADLKLIRTYSNHKSKVYGLEYINEEMIATGGTDRTIQIWSLSTGLTNITIKTDIVVMSLASLKYGTHLASGFLYYTYIHIYDLSNKGNLTSILMGHEGNVNDLVFIENGNLLASSSWDSTIIIWDLNTNTIKFQLKGHVHFVYGLKLVSPTTLVSGSLDNTTKLWDITTGRIIRTFSNHRNFIYYSIDTLNDGKTLVSGSLDEEIICWDMSTGKVLTSLNTSLEIYSLAVVNF